MKNTMIALHEFHHLTWLLEEDRLRLRDRIEEGIRQDHYRFSILDSLVAEEVDVFCGSDL